MEPLVTVRSFFTVKNKRGITLVIFPKLPFVFLACFMRRFYSKLSELWGVLWGKNKFQHGAGLIYQVFEML